MKVALAVIVGIIGVFILTVLIILGSFLSTLSQEGNLRAGIEAHENAREASFDNMKKIIAQQAQVPAALRADLEKLMPILIEGRKGGAAFKSVQESFPTMTQPLYENLMRSIEAQRTVFLNEQKSLFDVKREDDALFNGPISGFWLGLAGRHKVDVKVISSAYAKEVRSSGEDNEVDLNLNK